MKLNGCLGCFELIWGDFFELISGPQASQRLAGCDTPAPSGKVIPKESFLLYFLKEVVRVGAAHHYRKRQMMRN